MMQKLLLSQLALAYGAASLLTTAADADTTVAFNPNATWIGYMNVFNNAAGAKGTFVFGSGWGFSDVKSTLNTGTGTLTLQPNFSTYTNALGGTDADRAFWTDSSDGGVTAGPNGNKWMEGNTFVEVSDGSLVGGNLTFTGMIDSFTLLSSNYSASAFIKAIDPSAGFATVLYDTTSIAGAGSFSVSTNLTTAPASWIIQYGFSVEGLNSNPANEAALGSVVVAVPEPSTYAAILGSLAALALLFGRRQPK